MVFTKFKNVDDIVICKLIKKQSTSIDITISFNLQKNIMSLINYTHKLFYT